MARNKEPNRFDDDDAAGPAGSGERQDRDEDRLPGREGPRVPEREPTPADPGRRGPQKRWAPGEDGDEGAGERHEPNSVEAEREARGPGRTARKD